MKIPVTTPYLRLNGPMGLKLTLNANEIFANDPGQGTPCLLELPSGDTVTFACALSEGETADGEQLEDSQLAWLTDIEDGVDAWLTHQTGLARNFAS